MPKAFSLMADLAAPHTDNAVEGLEKPDHEVQSGIVGEVSLADRERATFLRIIANRLKNISSNAALTIPPSPAPKKLGEL